jgi:chromosome segregation ATPase
MPTPTETKPAGVAQPAPPTELASLQAALEQVEQAIRQIDVKRNDLQHRFDVLEDELHDLDHDSWNAPIGNDAVAETERRAGVRREFDAVRAQLIEYTKTASALDDKRQWTTRQIEGLQDRARVLRNGLRQREQTILRKLGEIERAENVVRGLKQQLASFERDVSQLQSELVPLVGAAS